MPVLDKSGADHSRCEGGLRIELVTSGKRGPHGPNYFSPTANVLLKGFMESLEVSAVGEDRHLQVFAALFE
jgi:hypothetical protein